MKKTILLLALFISISLIYFHFQPRQTKSESTNEISGAYEALNALGAQRTYPNKSLPSKAYYAAWEASKNLQATEKSNPITDPWETMGPLNLGGRTLCVEFNHLNTQTMYLGSASGGLWRSHTAGDGDLAWHRVNTGFPILGVGTIAIHPIDTMTMYIGTGEVYNHEAAGTGAAFRNTRGSYGMGILKTSDGGATWSKSLDWSYAQNHGVWSIKFDLNDPTVIWAATTNGTYKSTDEGANWIKILDVVMANDLVVNPLNSDEIIVGCGNLNSAEKGIYKTTDGGTTWTLAGGEIPTDFKGKIQLNYAPSNPTIVYASIGNGFSGPDGASWLFRSDDFGENWELKSTEDYSRWQGWFAHDVAVDPSDPNKITVIGIEVWQSISTGYGFILNKITEGGSNQGGSDLGCTIPDSFVHSDAHDVKYHPTDPSIIYIAHDGGISKSLNGGTTFQTCSGGYQTVQFYNGFSSAIDNPDWAMGGLQDNGTIVYEGDNIWRRRHGGDGAWTAIDPSGNHYYASSQYLGLSRKDPETHSSEYIRPSLSDFEPLAFIAPYAVAPSRGQYLYAASSKVYKSRDFGDTWEITNNGEELDENPVFSMAISPLDEDIVYVGTAPYINEPGVFVTLDEGETWNDVSEGLRNRYPMDIAIDPNNHALAYVVYSGYGTGHVFKTLSFGNNWTDITEGLPDVPTNAVIVDPANSAHVYVGNDLGVFFSPDRGQTWEAYQDGLPTAIMVFDLSISPSNRKLRIASHGNGAYQRDLVEFINVSNDNIFAETFDLNIFPLPAKDNLNLSFNLKKSANTYFEITDLSGRQIYQSQPKTLPKGANLEQIAINNYPDGLYFITLHVDNQYITKKLQISN